MASVDKQVMNELKNHLAHDGNDFYIILHTKDFRDNIHKEFSGYFGSDEMIIGGTEEEKNKINNLLSLTFPDKTFYEGDSMRYPSDMSFAIIDYKYLKICNNGLVDTLNSIFKLKHFNGDFYTIEDINGD